MLDVCTGLAYTSCVAFEKYGARVTTIELDRTMTAMCRMNPHSRPLFEGGIEQLSNAPRRQDASRRRIRRHRPRSADVFPAGELYSTEFYAELKRILKSKGRIYHYIGDPKSSAGLAAGVIRRLKEIGLDAAIDYDAHGIVASRGRARLNRTKKKPASKRSAAADGKRARTSRRGGRGRRRRDTDWSDDDDDDDDEYY